MTETNEYPTRDWASLSVLGANDRPRHLFATERVLLALLDAGCAEDTVAITLADLATMINACEQTATRTVRQLRRERMLTTVARHSACDSQIANGYRLTETGRRVARGLKLELMSA